MLAVDDLAINDKIGRMPDAQCPDELGLILAIHYAMIDVDVTQLSRKVTVMAAVFLLQLSLHPLLFLLCINVNPAKWRLPCLPVAGVSLISLPELLQY